MDWAKWENFQWDGGMEGPIGVSEKGKREAEKKSLEGVVGSRKCIYF